MQHLERLEYATSEWVSPPNWIRYSTPRSILRLDIDCELWKIWYFEFLRGAVHIIHAKLFFFSMQDMTESFVKMNGLEEPIFNLLYEMLLLYIDFRFYIISFGLRIFCRDGLLSGQNLPQNLTRLELIKIWRKMFFKPRNKWRFQLVSGIE